MIMYPSVLPPKTSQEAPAIYMQLEPAIGTATIVGTPVFSSAPTGLTFGTVTVIDGAQTTAVFCGGGQDGVTYTVSALCALSNGEIVEAIVSLPVVADASEVTQRRPVVL